MDGDANLFATMLKVKMYYHYTFISCN